MKMLFQTILAVALCAASVAEGAGKACGKTLPDSRVTINVYDADGKASGKIVVEAEEGEVCRKVCEAKFSRVNHCRDVGFLPHAPVIAPFASDISRVKSPDGLAILQLI